MAEDGDNMEQRQLLADHDTVATFRGIQKRQCMFRTSECPDRCNHPNTFANFDITKYLSYTKLGEYGDPQAEHTGIDVKTLTPEHHQVLDTLVPGDTVRLAWHHDYVTLNGCSGPQRPVQRLEKQAPQEEASGH